MRLSKVFAMIAISFALVGCATVAPPPKFPEVPFDTYKWDCTLSRKIPDDATLKSMTSHELFLLYYDAYMALDYCKQLNDLNRDRLKKDLEVLRKAWHETMDAQTKNR